MTDLAVSADRAPALAGFATATPALTLQRGKAVADAAAPVIKDLGLVKRIHQSFHVYFDGWTMVGAMVGVFPVTVRTWEIGEDEGYGANVEARTLDGSVVGAADAIVMRDEEVGGKRKWLDAPTFQVISMAQTRAGGKALRQPLGWIMRLAGYEATPAEEMDEAAAARGETVSGGRGVAPGWRDIGEQNNAHHRLNAFLANHGLGEWAAKWLESKGYPRPLSRAQMNDLRRAVDRELEARAEQSGGSRRPSSVPTDADASPPGANSPPARTEQEVSPTEADRSRADGSNQQHTEQGAGADDAASGATVAPDGSDSPDRPSGGAKRSRPGGARGRSLPGRDDPDEAKQAAFDQQFADDPEEFAR